MSSQFQKYYRAVAYLESLALQPLKADYLKKNAKDPRIYLERTNCLLKLLGDPHRGFKYIHVSGTAGKGSTVAFLHQMLYLSGFRVGSFYSPFATTSIEKIKFNDKLIDPLVFARLTKKIKIAANKMINSKYGRPSYFECFFALALLYFKIMRCEWVVLEVGLGGAFDATNIISRSEASAITNVGLDHTDILGKTLLAIARDKAGIIKPNSHFFTTEDRPSLLKIFKAVCKKQRTKFHPVPPHCRDVARYVSTVRNAALAASIAHHLKIDNKIINQAISQTALPCRFEIIQKNPLIILDGAHNPLKIKSVMHNLKSLTYRKLYTMFASAHNKDARRMLKQLERRSDEIIFTQMQNKGRAFHDPARLAKLVSAGCKKSIEGEPRAALVKTLKKMKSNDALLITGSFYLAGELRKYWISEEKILRKRKT